MKKTLLTITMTLVALLGAIGLSGCGDDDGTWGDNIYYDPALRGSWQLVQVNGQNVGGYDTNYLTFYGRGSGLYYFFSNGYLVREQTSYWCAEGYTRDTITINYADGQTSTMNYWFSAGGSSLWMQWQTLSGQTVLYRYVLVSSVPY